MASANDALSIPEVLHLVYGRVDELRTLARCSQVSKQWHALAIPLLWHGSMHNYNIDAFGCYHRSKLFDYSFRQPSPCTLIDLSSQQVASSFQRYLSEVQFYEDWVDPAKSCVHNYQEGVPCLCRLMLFSKGLSNHMSPKAMRIQVAWPGTSSIHFVTSLFSTNLRYLAVKGIGQPEYLLDCLTQHCPNLRGLQYEIGDGHGSKTFEKCFPLFSHLSHLVLQGKRRLIDKDADLINVLAYRLPKLKVLRVEKALNMSKWRVNSGTRRPFPELLALSVRASHEGLTKLLSVIPRLQTVELSRTFGLKSSGNRLLRVLAKCSDLRDITIDDPPDEIDPPEQEEILEAMQVALEDLKHLGRSCPHMREVDLNLIPVEGELERAQQPVARLVDFLQARPDLESFIFLGPIKWSLQSGEIQQLAVKNTHLECLEAPISFHIDPEFYRLDRGWIMPQLRTLAVLELDDETVRLEWAAWEYLLGTHLPELRKIQVKAEIGNEPLQNLIQEIMRAKHDSMEWTPSEQEGYTSLREEEFEKLLMNIDQAPRSSGRWSRPPIISGQTQALDSSGPA